MSKLSPSTMFDVDLSDAKIKSMIGKPWSSWNLPVLSSDTDSLKMREANKPKEPDKPRDQCNLLPRSLLALYGTKPEVEYFSVTKCPACRCVMKSQWITRHFKRDSGNSLVCRRTEMIVSGNRCLVKATHPLYDIRVSEKDNTAFAMLGSYTTSTTTTPTTKVSTRIQNTNTPVTIPKLSPPQKHSSHKTEPIATITSSSKSKSNSSPSSHSKKHSSSSTSSSQQSTSSSNKHHKSSSSSKGVSPSNASTSWSKKESSSSSSSSKSHKPHNTASYVLSIPSDDSSHNESVESILLSNSKQSMHIITGKSKSSEPEYEQLKFYADSSDKRSKAAADSKAHKLHFSPQLENFKIPLKNKPSSSSSSSNTADAIKKSKSSSGSHNNHSTKSSSANNDSNNSKNSFRHSSNSSSSSSTVTKPVPSLTIISEAPKMNIIPIIIAPHVISEVKEKSSSHSKKKKKKKSRDEPRKIIPLKERAFNPDQHCGVVVSEETLPCTRSLTCKTHSIALRRAVPGRSNQFDSLLAAHKKARDEEKAKSKEIVDDSKSKGKKISNSVPPVPADSDSSSSSLPQPPSVGNKGSSAGGGKLTTSSSSSSITFNATSVTTTTTAAATTSSNNNNNVKHSTVGNAHHHHPPGSKTVASSHPQSLRQQQQITKSTATKTTNRPVIIVDEKKETKGLSIFELRREPENNFVYVTRIEAPKMFANSKELDGKSLRSNALSEWNPLDRFSRKGVGNAKKKGFKDPLVSLLLPYKSGNSGTSILVADTQGKELISNIGESELCVDVDGRTTTTASAALGRANNSSSSKRKSTLGPPNMNDSGMGSVPAKKARLVSSTQEFYETLLFKTSQKPECKIKLQQRSEVASPGKTTSTTTSEGLPEGHTDLKSTTTEEYYVPKTNVDSLPPEAKEYLQCVVKTRGDKTLLAKMNLSEEEMYAYAYELLYGGSWKPSRLDTEL